MSKVVAVVPARGGSKALPLKSIALVAGKPLLAWTAHAALAATRLDRVLLSTDDERIAEVGAASGLEVPFMRPTALAADDTPMTDVLSHALHWLEEQHADVEAVVLLQPTSPLRRAEHIDAAVDLLRATKAESVVSIVEVPHQYSPASLLLREEDGSLYRWDDRGPLVTRRQDKPRVFARNGPAVVAHLPDVVRRKDAYGSPLVGYQMTLIDSFDIDGPDDLTLVQALLLERSQANPAFS